jgi:purine-cytosine permease-like protein
MRWTRIAWATVIAVLSLFLVVNIEDQLMSEVGFHLNGNFITLAAIIILVSYLAVRRKSK